MTTETSAPTTATPKVEPIWREVLAMADATPAWDRGIPETAVLVIGAFTNPNPMPKTTYAVNNHVNGVVALSPTNIRQEPVRATPATSRGILAPRMPTTRPEIGESSMVMTAIGSVSIPACSAESPRTSCR